MSLKGNLQSVDLANVLQMLSINQKEGTLILFDGDTRKSIYFSKDGVSMLSRGRRGQDTLGRILLRYGKVTPEILSMALEKQRAEQKRLGDALKEMGAVTDADIDDAVRTQIEEEIYNLFIWKEASFEFVEGPPPDSAEAHDTRVTFNVNSLIMEAQRRADEWNYIRGLVPSLDEIYKPTDKMAEAVVTDDVFRFPFAPRLLEVLQGGRRNIHEIIDASHAAKFEACKILAILLEQGAIEPVSIADLQAFAMECSTKGEHEQAAKFLSRVVDLGGATPGINMSLGYALEAIEEPERASVYFKAAAEAYIEAIEPKHAFEALVRVSRALPTDLVAVTQLVELACNNEEVLAANRHEVVETGRVLAQCLRELGRLPAAIQTLHKLSQASPTDMPLRNMLVQAYQDAGLNNEAVVELESMADLSIRAKNFDEAIRCLRRVLAIDRNRANVQKKIEQLTRQRDAGKRMVLKLVAGGTVMAAVAAMGYGFVYMRGQRAEEQERVNQAISQVLDPLVSQFDAAEKEFQKKTKALQDWKKALPASIQADWAELERHLQAMKQCLADTRSKAAALYTEHDSKADISDTFVEDRSASMARRVREGDETRKGLKDEIRESAIDDFANIYEASFTRPLQNIPSTEKVVKVLTGIGESRDLTLKGKPLNVELHLKALLGYKAEIEREQDSANKLWADGRRAEAHAQLARYLGRLSTVEEFAERLRFHIAVTSVPAKARARILRGPGTDLPAVDLPTTLHYAPAEGLRYEVSAEGFETTVKEIAALKAPFREPDLKRLPIEITVVLTKVPVWSQHLGAGGVDSAPCPTADGKSVVVADRSGSIHLISLEDGKVRVSHNANSPSGFPGGVVVTADSVYAASADGEGVVVALDLPGLTPRWRKSGDEGVGAVYGTPLLLEDTLVVASEAGLVRAYDAKSGEFRWELRLPSGTHQPVLWARGSIVVFCEDGPARALVPDGSVIAVLPTSREEGSYPPPRARPLAAGDKVLFGPEGQGSEFSLVELPVPGAASPHIGYRWGARRESAEPSGATLSGEDVLLLFTDGTLLRASLRKGAAPGEPALRVLPEKEKPVGGPVLAGDLLLIASERGISAVRRGVAGITEAWKWTAPAGVVLSTQPVVCGRHVLVGTRDGRVHALLVD